METLVVGDCVMQKQDQDPALRVDYKDKFELD
jgi:carbamoyltransferase